MQQIGPFTATALESVIEVERIVTLHYFEYARDFLFSGEKHDFWELAYIDRGEVGVVADTAGYDLRQGEAIFHKPNEYHNIGAKGDFANAIIITFVCHSPAMDFFKNRIIRFSKEHTELLAKLLAAGEKAFEGPLNIVHQTKLDLAQNVSPSWQQVFKNYLEILLLRLMQSDTDILRQQRLSNVAKAHNDRHIVQVIERILENHIYLDLHFDDILQSVCFSKSYITKLFHDTMGCSVMEHYTRLKINEAQRLISLRTLSFTEIAEQLHLGSVHYFSRLFKRKTGMTPTQYTRSVQSRSIL